MSIRKRPIVLLARPNQVDGRREFLAIRLEDFRSLYIKDTLSTLGCLSVRIKNSRSSWACSPKSMVDEFTG